VLRAEHDLDGARSGFEDVARKSRCTGHKYALAGAILKQGLHPRHGARLRPGIDLALGGVRSAT
jgi:hypothetical protein